MEVTYAKDYTIIHLRIEEDLANIEEALSTYISDYEMPDANEKARNRIRDMRALLKAISNMNKRKDLQLRFS